MNKPHHLITSHHSHGRQRSPRRSQKELAQVPESAPKRIVFAGKAPSWNLWQNWHQRWDGRWFVYVCIMYHVVMYTLFLVRLCVYNISNSLSSFCTTFAAENSPQVLRKHLSLTETQTCRGCLRRTRCPFFKARRAVESDGFGWPLLVV